MKFPDYIFTESPFKSDLKLVSQFPATRVRPSLNSNNGDFMVLQYRDPNTGIQSYYCGVRICSHLWFRRYWSGHVGAAVLLPGFAISW